MVIYFFIYEFKLKKSFRIKKRVNSFLYGMQEALFSESEEKIKTVQDVKKIQPLF